MIMTESKQTTTEVANDPLGECKACPNWDVVKERGRVSKLLDSAIHKVEAKLSAKDYKPTVAEYLKLLQLEKELEGQQLDKEIHVTWVGPTVKFETEE
jgi:hypothetical protein